MEKWKSEVILDPLVIRQIRSIEKGLRGDEISVGNLDFLIF